MPHVSIGEARVGQRGYTRIWLVAPIIYAMMVPIFFLDMCMRVYQWICFPAYGIACVDRKKFMFKRPRGKGYLPALDRFNCSYCGYANGAIAFVRAVLIETEKYWCPIRHIDIPAQAKELEHRKNFAADGDEEALRKKLINSKS